MTGNGPTLSMISIGKNRKGRNRMNWLLENKEWFFSGAGVFALSIVIHFIHKKTKAPHFSIKSGDGCINTQVNKNAK
jgi:hypothetical protein